MEVISNLNLDNTHISTAERYAGRVIDRVLIFCGRQDVPKQLEKLAVEITEEMLYADGVVTRPEEVSSVSRGDTTIHYRDPGSAYQKADTFLKDYEGLLRRFKRMNLPGDGDA